MLYNFRDQVYKEKNAKLQRVVGECLDADRKLKEELIKKMVGLKMLGNDEVK